MSLQLQITSLFSINSLFQVSQINKIKRKHFQKKLLCLIPLVSAIFYLTRFVVNLLKLLLVYREFF